MHDTTLRAPASAGRSWRRRPVPPDAPTGRVRQAILAEQQAAERTVGWVQMAIVLTFGGLYAVSPKTFMMDVPIEPVPWALSSWFLFTTLRLGLAYRRPLPGWLLTLSVVIDMGVLMLAIWSFHIQYAQPPAFYLKAPTLLYVFIFIALRTLRFEARYVLLAGGVAALGWLLLLGYAIEADPAPMRITHDYVQYMTSASILLGGEFDKILSILVVTGVLALAIRRARRMLFRAVTESTAAMDLKRFFDPAVARRITGAEMLIRPGQGELRQAAVMFIDLRGFTPLSRTLAPSDLMALLADYQARMLRAVQDHHGTIDKFLGDGILASFGTAQASDTHAADALSAADAVIDAARAWAAERRAAGLPVLEVGLGIASGAVVFGAVGDATRLEYTVIGDAVNLAAKLEKHNKTAGTTALTTAETYALAVAQGFRDGRARTRRDAAAVAGVPHPIDLAVLAP